MSHFLEENSANVPWSGCDEEIMKQTGGFTRDQESANRSQAKAKKLQQRPGEEGENMGLSQIIKKKKNQTIKTNYWRKGGGVKPFSSSFLTN